MADVHSRTIRSKNMQAIKASDTKPEMLVRKSLHQHGFRFRLHDRELPGKPDIVLPKYRTVIFVNGCFWHRHNCGLFRLPKTRTGWWDAKLSANRSRDEQICDKLREMGWRVAIVWECSVKGKTSMPLSELTQVLAAWIKKYEGNYIEIPQPAIG